MGKGCELEESLPPHGDGHGAGESEKEPCDPYARQSLTSERKVTSATGGLMAVLETDRLVDGERLRRAVLAFREAGDRGLTRLQLAEAMGQVGLRTADRARKLLEDQGAKLDQITNPRTRERAFIMRNGPKWDESISQATRLALRVAAMTLGQGGNAILEQQLAVLEEITDKNLTNKDRKTFERLRSNIRVAGGVSESLAGNQVAILEVVLKAFSAEIPRQLELDYRKPGASVSRKMTFSPYCFTQDLISGGTYLLGLDVEKQRISQIRLCRIEQAKVLARPVIFLKDKLKELERAAEHQVGGWASAEEPFEVVIRLEGAHWIQAMEEARPDFPGFNLEKKGSHAIVRFRANQPIGLMRWILQLGPCAEVVEPKSLRVAVREDVEAMMRLYR